MRIVQRLFLQRSIVLRSACLLCAVMLFALIVPLVHTRPQWLKSIDAENDRWKWPERLRDDDARRIHSAVWQDILRRSIWDVKEVDDIWQVYEQFEESQPPVDPEAAERWKELTLVQLASVDAISARLEHRAPMTDAAREHIVSLLVEDLNHPWHFRRGNAASILIEYNFIEDRTIRLAVERLLDDPDIETGKTVAIMLANYDDVKARRLALEDRKRALQERQAKAKGAP